MTQHVQSLNGGGGGGGGERERGETERGQERVTIAHEETPPSSHAQLQYLAAVIYSNDNDFSLHSSL